MLIINKEWLHKTIGYLLPIIRRTISILYRLLNGNCACRLSKARNAFRLTRIRVSDLRRLLWLKRDRAISCVRQKVSFNFVIC